MAKKIDLLIVDDSEKVISNLKVILKDIDSIKSIKIAGTIAAAEEIVFKDRPDVIILDIQLPDGNGVELLKKVKKDFPATIVIMFSDQVELFSEIYRKRFGADYFVDKSMEFEEVANIIRNI
jgi:DNA-binding NarL/FixJ family response regulator